MGFREMTGPELEREVEEVGGVPFRSEVPLDYLSREELSRYLSGLLDEEYPESRARIDERTLVAFDLLEPTVRLRDVRRRMLLEIKLDAGRARYPGIEEKVLAILDRHRMAGSTVVMAFEPATLKRMRELRPDLAVCALYSARMLGRTTLAAELEALKAAGVGFVGLDHTVVDEAALAQARRAGIQVGAWTVNDAAAMKRLIDAGVGVLITDQPDVAKTLLGR